MVIGSVTTLYKFEWWGKPMYLPCLYYDLPSAEICVLPPQTYHTLYGRHITVFGGRVVMMIDHSPIKIPSMVKLEMYQ